MNKEEYKNRVERSKKLCPNHHVINKHRMIGSIATSNTVAECVRCGMWIKLEKNAISETPRWELAKGGI